jgi:predicted anti-sigma-YlaC factor YlaD
MSGSLRICEQVLALLSDYLDDDLDTESAAKVERHLQECMPCLAFANGLRRTIELCRRYRPAVRPRPLTPWARAELEKAWQTALAGRQRHSNPE